MVDINEPRTENSGLSGIPSEPIRGVPVGSALASLPYLDIYHGNDDWSFQGILKNRARFFYRHLWHLRTRKRPPDISRNTY